MTFQVWSVGVCRLLAASPEEVGVHRRCPYGHPPTTHIKNKQKKLDYIKIIPFSPTCDLNSLLSLRDCHH